MAFDLAAIKKAKQDAPALKIADMDDLFWVIAGEKQVGKSTFLSRFPDPFIVDVEHRLDSITMPNGERPGQHKVFSWDELKQVTETFAGHPTTETGFKTLCIDGGGVAYRLLAQKILGSSKKKAQHLNDEDLGYNKGWNVAANEFLAWWMSLRKLKEQGYGIVVTTHDRTITFSDNGIEKDKKVPLFADDKNEKYGWSVVKPFSDVVISVFKQRTANGIEHVAQLRGHDLIEAGFPSKPDGSLMPDQLPFSYAAFREAWDG